MTQDTRTAIVVGVGAEEGLGGALCARFAREGLHVLAAGRTAERLEALAAAIRATGGQATPVVTDTARESDVVRLFDAAGQLGGPPELVAYNAGNNAIMPLADFFRSKFAALFGKQVDSFSDAARDTLRRYPWPGNIRELQNVVERAVILARGVIDGRDLNLEPGTDRLPGRGGLREVERETIERVMRETAGNRRKAAAQLGISLRTLQYRLKEYGLS